MSFRARSVISALSRERDVAGGESEQKHFDYRISALRRKYENIRFKDHTNDPMMKQMREEAKAAELKATSGDRKPAAAPVAR